MNKMQLQLQLGRAVVVDIGVARIFDWGRGPNHKSHAMMSSEIIQRGNLYGAKIL